MNNSNSSGTTTASPRRQAGVESPVPPPTSRSNPGSPPPPAIRPRNVSFSQESDGGSDSSAATTTFATRGKRSPYGRPGPPPPGAASSATNAAATNLSSTSINSNTSTPSLQTNFSRPGLPRPSLDSPLRTQSPASDTNSSPWQPGHRPRQRSQGYFEPSLPSQSAIKEEDSNSMSGLSASQIAAQAAMQNGQQMQQMQLQQQQQQQQQQQHARRRSTTIPERGTTGGRIRRVSPPPALPASSPPPVTSDAHTRQREYDEFVGGNRLAAATAANAAFPKSPGLMSPEFPRGPEKELKTSRSKIKLFSKPKNIGIPKNADVDRKVPPLPSPAKALFAMGSAVNASSSSLVDPSMSAASSIYSSANASTSTLVPLNDSSSKAGSTLGVAADKDKKHHLFSRDRKRNKEDLQLSSAMSNSRLAEPNAAQLYSFAPASPAPTSTFAKSVSGLDLRHGGRALREKKKEEKAAAAANAAASMSTTSLLQNRAGETHPEWPTVGTNYDTSASVFGTANSTPFSTSSETPQTGLLSGMTADDAWPLLKARILNVFSGEELRTTVEDFNMLVSVHLRHCVSRRQPVVLIEDLREVLHTGFSSLDQTLRHFPSDRLIPRLVDMWMMVFGTILPYIQAVFLPLDLEFRGRGPLMTAPEAAEFWGARLPGSDEGGDGVPTLGEELDVRRIVLLTFRDTVILPRHDTLMAIFSRLSLDNINTGTESASVASTLIPADHPGLPPLKPPPSRTGTSNSGSIDPASGSYNSTTSSTLLDSSTSSLSLGARSRATSNTSAGSFSALSPHHNTANMPNPLSTTTSNSTLATLTSPPPPTSASAHGSQGSLPPFNGGRGGAGDGGGTQPKLMDSSRVTETVGRMLQCISVLATVQSRDDSQELIERLARELKYNWLGRGRTGRNRRGIVQGRRAGAQNPLGVPGATGNARGIRGVEVGA